RSSLSLPRQFSLAVSSSCSRATDPMTRSSTDAREHKRDVAMRRPLGHRQIDRGPELFADCLILAVRDDADDLLLDRGFLVAESESVADGVPVEVTSR